MMEFGGCPRCKLEISNERKAVHPIVCNHCGYSVTSDERKQKSEMEKRTTAVMLAISLFTVAAYVQIVHWDTAALSILPLTAKELTGTSGPQDWEQKASICFDLKKWDCVESEYVKAAQADASKWQRAGDFQSKRAKYPEAAQSYFNFFQNGGESLDASYSYAKALAKLGRVDEAVKYFDQVLAARPDVLQVTVVQNYVNLLMEHQRYAHAKVLIQDIRRKAGPAATLFMDAQFDEIESLTTASRD